MAIRWPERKDRRSLARCGDCDAIVNAVLASGGRGDANTECASCGLARIEEPSEGIDYFDVIMRIGPPVGRTVRPRRA
jgi:hypothetical protein